MSPRIHYWLVLIILQSNLTALLMITAAVVICWTITISFPHLFLFEMWKTKLLTSVNVCSPTATENDSWAETLQGCQNCSLELKNNSIYTTKESLYFVYAQVTFTKFSKTNQNKFVYLRREARFGKHVRTLVEGTLPYTTGGSLWVARIIKLQAEDSVSLMITDDYLHDKTFWGAYELR